MNRDLVIFGTGALGRLVHQIVADINASAPTWHLIGFLDEDTRLHDCEMHHLPVLGDGNWLKNFPHTSVVIAVGDPSVRCTIAKKIQQSGHTIFATLIHPLAWVANRVAIGEGAIIYPGVMIDVDVTIGRHVILNKNCTIGHDSLLADYVTVAPGVNIGGDVVIGEGCDLGMNCSIIQELRIGDWSIVGANAAVIRDVPAHVTTVGVPAHVLKALEK